MKKLRNLSLIILLIAGFQKVLSNPLEINIGTSIDWLIYDADIIITGVLKETLENKNANPITDFQCTNLLNVSMIYKGDIGTDKIRFTTRLPYIGGHQLQKLINHEVVLFLKNVDGKFHAWDDVYSLISLNNPNNYALTGSFNSLKKGSEIIDYIEQTLEKIGDKKAKPYYLEIPYNSEIHPILYSGSSCYLIVPDILYPSSKKSLLD